MDTALALLAQAPPDVFNHNLETVPRLYRAARPGADYTHSLALLQRFKQCQPQVLTKSGLMVGLGETNEEIEAVMHDLRAHGCDLLTIGQYLQPSRDHHLQVERYVTPAEFERYAEVGKSLGFRNVASGPLVRSSYHAEQQSRGF
jgi:lipoic acid synthetase